MIKLQNLSLNELIIRFQGIYGTKKWQRDIQYLNYLIRNKISRIVYMKGKVSKLYFISSTYFLPSASNILKILL